MLMGDISDAGFFISAEPPNGSVSAKFFDGSRRVGGKKAILLLDCTIYALRRGTDGKGEKCHESFVRKKILPPDLIVAFSG